MSPVCPQLGVRARSVIKLIRRNQMTKCYNCGKPASWIVPGKTEDIPYCLDCYDKYQRILERQNAQAAQAFNLVADSLEARIGLPGILPRYKTPQPIIHQGPMNNIKVDGSVVGSINTGQIEKLDVNLSHIRMGGEEALSTALQTFAQAVINEQKINKEEKAKL